MGLFVNMPPSRGSGRNSAWFHEPFARVLHTKCCNCSQAASMAEDAKIVANWSKVGDILLKHADTPKGEAVLVTLPPLFAFQCNTNGGFIVSIWCIWWRSVPICQADNLCKLQTICFGCALTFAYSLCQLISWLSTRNHGWNVCRGHGCLKLTAAAMVSKLQVNYEKSTERV